MPLTLTAAEDDSGRRLDRILRKALKDLPLSAIHRLLRKGAVLIDGKASGPDYRVKAGQTITIMESNAEISLNNQSYPSRKEPKSQRPQEELEILFEGEGLLILNKPVGISVHGKDSLEDQVISYLGPKLPHSLSFRPGPLHRLDKPSSGITVFSTSLEGARFFSNLLQKRKLKKQYLAIVEGTVKQAEVWWNELTRDHEKKKTFTIEAKSKSARSQTTSGQAKSALTRITPMACNAGFTLILAEIETGRTHQIRAQAAAHGHPLLGDKKYGSKTVHTQKNSNDPVFFLHAWQMEFPEELYENKTTLPRKIKAPLPDLFQRKLDELFEPDSYKL